MKKVAKCVLLPKGKLSAKLCGECIWMDRNRYDKWKDGYYCAQYEKFYPLTEDARYCKKYESR